MEARTRRPPRSRPAVETLEGRSLLSSVSPALVAVTNPGLSPTIVHSTLPTSTTVGGRVAGRLVLDLVNTAQYAATGTAVVSVVATPVGAADFTGTLLATVDHTVALAAGGSTRFTVAVPPTTVLSAATCTLHVFVNSVQSGEGETTAGPTLTVTAPAGPVAVPMAVAVVGTPPGDVVLGRPVAVEVSVTDVGTGVARGPLGVTLAVSQDGLTVPLETVRRTATLRPGHAVLVRLRATLPTAVYTGLGDTLQVTAVQRTAVAAAAPSRLDVTAGSA